MFFRFNSAKLVPADSRILWRTAFWSADWIGCGAQSSDRYIQIAQGYSRYPHSRQRPRSWRRHFGAHGITAFFVQSLYENICTREYLRKAKRLEVRQRISLYLLYLARPCFARNIRAQ